jgi:hypothetical protein
MDKLVKSALSKGAVLSVRIGVGVPCSCSTKVVHYIGNVETVDRYHPGAPNCIDSNGV